VANPHKRKRRGHCGDRHAIAGHPQRQGFDGQLPCGLLADSLRTSYSKFCPLWPRTNAKISVNVRPRASRRQGNNPKSQYLVGLYYATKENGELDYAEAARWYLKAANSGYAQAQNKLANILINGEDGVPQDIEQAISLYTKAAQQGNAAAQFNLAWQYDTGRLIKQDNEKAIFWYTKAAEQSDSDAQFNLGNYYRIDDKIKNLKTAVFWYTKAAEQGNPDAQFNLGTCYKTGEGAVQDFGTAAYWYQKSADQGNATAQNSLGNFYADGDGVEKIC